MSNAIADTGYTTLNIPKFAGYKTIVINFLVIAAGVLTVYYPSFVLPPADQLGIAYDTLTGAAVAIIGAINVVLRLMTHTPVASPVNLLGTRVGLTPSPDDGEVADAWDAGYQRGHDTAWRTVIRAYPEVFKIPGPPVPGGAGSPSPRTSANRDMPHATSPTVSAPFADLQRVVGVERDRVEAAQMAGRFAATREPMAGPELPTVDPLPPYVLPQPPQPRIFDRSRVLAFMIPFLAPSAMVLALAGCSTIQQVNAIEAARTLEQRALATYGTFTVLEERGLAMVRDPRVSRTVKVRIKQADALAKPAADLVLTGVRSLKSLREAVEAYPRGEAPEAQAVTFQALSGKLEADTTALAGYVTTLSAAVEAK